MNLGAHRPSKKTLIVIIAVAVLGIAAGSAATYLAVRDDLTDAVQTSEQKNEVEKANNAFLEEKLPEGTISPTAIAANPDAYKGKELKVRGRVIEAGEGKYFLVGQEQKNPASVDLEITKNKIDIATFVSGYTDPSRFPQSTDHSNPSPKKVGPATVTGTLDPQDKELKLILSKIES